jgi:hypothetical protein
VWTSIIYLFIPVEPPPPKLQIFMKEFSILLCSSDYLVFKMLANLELDTGITKKNNLFFRLKKFHKMGITNDISIYIYIRLKTDKEPRLPERTTPH